MDVHKTKVTRPRPRRYISQDRDETRRSKKRLETETFKTETTSLDRVTADHAADARSDHIAYICSQALGEVRHRLVDVLLWKLFPDGLQGDFKVLIGRPRLRLDFSTV